MICYYYYFFDLISSHLFFLVFASDQELISRKAEFHFISLSFHFFFHFISFIHPDPLTYSNLETLILSYSFSFDSHLPPPAKYDT